MLTFQWASELTVPLIYCENNVCGLSRMNTFSLQTALYCKCQFWWIACQAKIQSKSWIKSIITWCLSLRKLFVLYWVFNLSASICYYSYTTYCSFLYYLSKLLVKCKWKGYILQKKLILFLLKLFQIYFKISKHEINSALSHCHCQSSQ